MASVGRVEALSDGVFAIAATLLILDIRLPSGSDAGHLWADLAAIWPSYLSFGLSFFVIIVSWMVHDNVVRLLRDVNRPFLLANAFLLMYVTFVPFSTSVLAEHLAGSERIAATVFYGGVFVVGSLALIAMFESIVRGNLFTPAVDACRIRAYRRGIWGGLALNLIATLVAFALPLVAIALMFAIRLFWLRVGHEILPRALARQSGAEL